MNETIIIPPIKTPNKSEDKKACLVIISGNPIGKIFFLEKDNIIGRSEEVTVELDDSTVSRKHAQITEENHRWIIKDLNSSNGTYVNFQMIDQKNLIGGETITIGSITLKFLVADEMEKNFFERIFNLTSHDSLTGAFSKAFFLEIASGELARALLYNRPLSFCMMDLDFFKKCNDTYGHLAGDFILKEWISLIQKNKRANDILGRLGGEEFGLLFPEQNIIQATQLIERLMTKTKDHAFIYNGTPIHITFSAGFSYASPDIKDLDHLIKLADEKLYEAKAAGRNCYRS